VNIVRVHMLVTMLIIGVVFLGLQRCAEFVHAPGTSKVTTTGPSGLCCTPTDSANMIARMTRFTQTRRPEA